MKRTQGNLWTEFTTAKFYKSTLQPHELANYEAERHHKDMAPKNNPLLHAKLYAFADRYLVQGLKSLSCDKLHQDLNAYPINGTTIPTLLELLSFVWANYPVTQKDELDPGHILLAYATSRAEQLIEYPPFQGSLGGMGDFGGAFAYCLTYRFSQGLVGLGLVPPS